MTPLRMTELEFVSLLSYSLRGNSSGASHSRNVMIALKTEKFVRDTSGKTLPMSEWVAEKIQRDKEKLEFASQGFFVKFKTEEKCSSPLNVEESLVKDRIGEIKERIVNGEPFSFTILF